MTEHYIKSDHEHLFHDWNFVGDRSVSQELSINDETLRDGLQAPGITHPNFRQKLVMVQLMNDIGISHVCVGYPAIGISEYQDIQGILSYIANNRLRIKVACAARTLTGDIQPILDLSQKTGLKIDANIFIGTSPIRKKVEKWDIDLIRRLIEESVSYAVKRNIPVCFITEDTTRSQPEDLIKVYTCAIDNGAYRICLCDTVGFATPAGTRSLIRFIKDEVIKDKPVELDWHGHNDRGLSLANALAAIEAGVNRIHTTGLGIGERTGNTPTEQLIVNMRLMGFKNFNLGKLLDYCRIISEACGYPIPPYYPMFSENAFKTTSGLHVSALMKAKQHNDNLLLDMIYSSIPAGELGMNPTIVIGRISGKSSIRYLLEHLGVALRNDLIDEIFNYLKLCTTEFKMTTVVEIIKKYDRDFQLKTLDMNFSVR
jgi:2-isopropylmalate synthase